MSQYVKICYGPYRSHHTTSHKPQRVRGLKDRLQKLNYRVDLVPVPYINYCVLEMFGYEVFRCNIQNLQFNTEAERDPVCQRAVTAVLSATKKFVHARVHIWINYLIEDRCFKEHGYEYVEHWPFDVNISPTSGVENCARCCGILTRFKNESDYQMEIKDCT